MHDTPLAPVATGWSDGLGRRTIVIDGDQRWLRLHVCSDLADAPLFETAVRLAAKRAGDSLAPDRALARWVDRQHDGHLVVTGPAPDARRIAGWLERAAKSSRPLPVDGAVTIAMRLLAAVTAFHASMKRAHGTLSVERTWIQGNGAIVLVDGIFAEALESLGWGRERLWRELHVPMPTAASLPRFDPRADLTQVAVITLELLLGRPLTANEYPQAVIDLITETTPGAASLPPDRVASGLRMWLQCAIPTHPRAAFTSVTEAFTALERLSHDTLIARTGPKTLAAWLNPRPAADRAMPVLPALDAAARTPTFPHPPELEEPDDRTGWRRLLPALSRRIS